MSLEGLDLYKCSTGLATSF